MHVSFQAIATACALGVECIAKIAFKAKATTRIDTAVKMKSFHHPKGIMSKGNGVPVPAVEAHDGRASDTTMATHVRP